MKGTRLAILVLVGLGAFSLASAQSLVTVYHHDFETPVGIEWSRPDRSITPIGANSFLGEFGGEPVVLSLYDLPEHCRVVVSFDLYVIGSWEGSVGHKAGPDLWALDVSAGPPNECPIKNLIHTTFANCECDYQAYPMAFPNVHNPGLTDAAEVGTLGFSEDSVYRIRKAFYHDEPDVYFTFQGSPDLQNLTDESWGIDNIYVELDSGGQGCCVVSRNLPRGYMPGVWFPVYLGVSPTPRAEAYVLEETPPAGWEVLATNNGGVVDEATGTIKWGPFYDTQRRVLAYRVLPPEGVTGTGDFSGVISLDGASQSFCGFTSIDEGSYHPADLDEDWVITADEFTGYAAAWKKGDPWSNDWRPPYSAPWVTNAGLIWKTGGSYSYDPSQRPPWVPGGGAAAQSGVAFSRIERDGAGYLVKVTVRPVEGTMLWAVEESYPVGWTVADFGTGAAVSPEDGSVRWGPFFGDEVQTVSYAVIPPAGWEGRSELSGVASFDGSETAVVGSRDLGNTAVVDPGHSAE